MLRIRSNVLPSSLLNSLHIHIYFDCDMAASATVLSCVHICVFMYRVFSYQHCLLHVACCFLHTSLCHRISMNGYAFSAFAVCEVLVF